MGSLSRIIARRAFAAALSVLAAGSAGAQGPPPGADPAVPWPDAAVAESLKVLASLDSAIRRDRRDAAAWYRRGMISWGLLYRARVGPPYRGLDWTRLGRQADTSLRIAKQLAPNNSRYVLSLGQYMLGSGQSSMRAQAYPMFDDALEAARRGGDSVFLAEALIEFGRMVWRRYDAVANTVHVDEPPAGLPECVFPGGAVWRRAEEQFANVDAFNAYHNARLECTRPVAGTGESDYARAESHFREAYTVSRGDQRSFRQLAMVMVEKNRWNELRTLARDRVQRVPADGWGWMALALGAYRGGSPDAAEALFDTAFTHFSESERARLGGLQRVLRPRDTLEFLRASADDRMRRTREHWRLADPLWSRAGDDPRTEFLARVAHAEFRWSVDELGSRGADSDRGEILIRYGPPDVIAVIRGAITHTLWDYDTGLFFIFEGAPTFGTSRFVQEWGARIADVTFTKPAAWDNMTRGTIHEMPVRLARFRTSGDSVDLYLAALAPMAAMRRSSAINTQATTLLWLLGEGRADIADTARTDADGSRVWMYRLAPANYMYRIEATANGVDDAGRAMEWFRVGEDTATGFATRGFGISDVVVATRVEPRGTPRRWTDYSVVPALKPVSSSGELAFLWENYDLAARNGESRYSIVLTIQRVRGVRGRVLAEVVGALSSVVGVNRRDDRVTFTWDRTVAHANVLVDNMAVSLRGTPAGNYRVTLEVTDRITNRKTSRTTMVTVERE